MRRLLTWIRGLLSSRPAVESELTDPREFVQVEQTMKGYRDELSVIRRRR